VLGTLELSARRECITSIANWFCFINDAVSPAEVMKPQIVWHDILNDEQNVLGGDHDLFEDTIPTFSRST
jgi:hypothetical protein